MSDKFKIKFREEEHGWFPIDVSVGDIKVEIDASDVPRDPIIEIVEAIEKCFLNNTESEAWLHLEPCYFRFNFYPCGETVNFKLYFIEVNYNQNKESIRLEYTGDYRELLLIFWRSLKDYTSKLEGYEKTLYFIESKVNEIK